MSMWKDLSKMIPFCHRLGLWFESMGEHSPGSALVFFSRSLLCISCLGLLFSWMCMAQFFSPAFHLSTFSWLCCSWFATVDCTGLATFCILVHCRKIYIGWIPSFTFILSWMVEGLMRWREGGWWQILTGSWLWKAKWHASTLADEWVCKGCSGGHLWCCVLLWCQWWIQVSSFIRCLGFAISGVWCVCVCVCVCVFTVS